MVPLGNYFIPSRQSQDNSNTIFRMNTRDEPGEHRWLAMASSKAVCSLTGTKAKKQACAEGIWLVKRTVAGLLQSENHDGMGPGHAVQVCPKVTVGTMVNLSPTA